MKREASSSFANIPTIRTSIQGRPGRALKAAFPVLGPHVSINELAEIAVVTINCKNSTLYIVLYIPLIDKTKYTIYKLRLLLVQQPILGDRTRRAYIRSKFAYLAMEETKRTYMLMTQLEYALYRKINSYLLCPGCPPSTRWPLIRPARLNSCLVHSSKPSACVIYKCRTNISFIGRSYHL